MNAVCLVLCCMGCLVLLAANTKAADNPQPAPPTTAPSAVFNWNDLEVKSTSAGERRSVLQAPTATLDELEVHITTLNPGEQAHAPHRHPHEEMILLKEGTLQAMINDKLIPMPTGSVLFIAPNDLHVVKNDGTTPATYFVVTWRTPRTGPEKQ